EETPHITKTVYINALTGEGADELKAAIISLGSELPQRTLLGDMVSAGDTVMLVMPQDASAPKGRLILPQVMTTRELLDKNAIVISVQPEEIDRALSVLKTPPDLVITDSQVFSYVNEHIPPDIRLTSFSILMAGLKGDLSVFMDGADRMMELSDRAKILIAESCTHAPAEEDIGRVKIPNMLRKKLGISIETEIAAGDSFPEDLSEYSLIIQCGGCMVGRRSIMNRIEAAVRQNIPITNYGIAIAKLTGILERVV
ncbi:MAG: [FeFe] hydrogenase H-cluster maturation GTPase HydF, partial [Lachnospiraceae bacterium]|nr:[FeFe] hydrogenase H-cluster maturation GTPase HydF [Lachnospiraceae bacterium]